VGSTFDTAFGLSPSAALRAGFDRLRTQLRMSPRGGAPQQSACLHFAAFSTPFDLAIPLHQYP